MFSQTVPHFVLHMCFSIVCSMGGLVVKQILHKAKEERFDNLVKNTMGIVSIDSLTKYMLKICRVYFYVILVAGFL